MGDARADYAASKRVFLEIVDLPPSEREAAILVKCEGDAALVAEVQRQLKHHQTSVGEDVHSADGLLLPGASIGPFTIVRRLGAGGMGEVFEARQGNPSRLVAIKVLGIHNWTRTARLRFEHEMQILASLEHPGIARLYQPVTVTVGNRELPGYAMELVSGQDLIAHARSHALDVRDRLALLASVADAVHFAHTRRIVHRDLKPGNILVDQAGAPKILDFGVARSIAEDGNADTLHTMAGAVIGTLQYMSPEQARGASSQVGARSDIYSLGVIGYELLSGRLPISIDGLDREAAIRAVLDHTPPALHSLPLKLDPEVCTLIERAMAKDPAQRYPSAAELAADIRRWLEGEAIRARPTGTLRRIADRLADRRALVAGVVVPLVALVVSWFGGIQLTMLASVAGLVATLFALDRSMRMRAERERTLAAMATVEQQRWDIFAAGNVWLENMDRQAINACRGSAMPMDPARFLDDVILRPGLAAIDRDLAGNLEVSASLRTAAGTAYRNLEMFDASEEQLTKALFDRQRLHAADHPDIAAAQANLGFTLLKAGQWGAAGEALLIAADLLRRRVEPEWQLDLAATLNSLGQVHLQHGDLPAAQAVFEEALAIRTRIEGPDHLHSARALLSLARCMERMGRAEEALAMYDQVISVFDRHISWNHELSVEAKVLRAESLTRLGRCAEAEATIRTVESLVDAPTTEVHIRRRVCEGFLAICLQRGEQIEADRWRRMAVIDEPRS